MSTPLDVEKLKREIGLAVGTCMVAPPELFKELEEAIDPILRRHLCARARGPRDKLEWIEPTETDAEKARREAVAHFVDVLDAPYITQHDLWNLDERIRRTRSMIHAAARQSSEAM